MSEPKKPKSATERRKPRYSADLNCMVFTKGLNHFLSERTANISRTGVFVCTDHPSSIDEKLHIRILLQDIDSYFDVKTKVVWVCDNSGPHPQGLGLEFIELTDEQNLVIENILKNYVNIKES